MEIGASCADELRLLGDTFNTGDDDEPADEEVAPASRVLLLLDEQLDEEFLLSEQQVQTIAKNARENVHKQMRLAMIRAIWSKSA